MKKGNGFYLVTVFFFTFLLNVYPAKAQLLLLYAMMKSDSWDQERTSMPAYFKGCSHIATEAMDYNNYNIMEPNNYTFMYGKHSDPLFLDPNKDLVDLSDMGSSRDPFSWKIAREGYDEDGMPFFSIKNSPTGKFLSLSDSAVALKSFDGDMISEERQWYICQLDVSNRFPLFRIVSRADTAKMISLDRMRRSNGKLYSLTTMREITSDLYGGFEMRSGYESLKFESLKPISYTAYPKDDRVCVLLDTEKNGSEIEVSLGKEDGIITQKDVLKEKESCIKAAGQGDYVVSVKIDGKDLGTKTIVVDTIPQSV